MSSDSSDDENTARLRESIDADLINNDMYKANPKRKREVYEKQPSLRPTKDRDDQFEDIGATPEFQQHVAKKLSNLLEERLRKRLTNKEATTIPLKRKKSGGVKLLSDSKKYLKVSKRPETQTVKPKVLQRNSDSDDEDKFREASVSSDSILQQEEVKHWSVRKDRVFNYKSQNNVLNLATD